MRSSNVRFSHCLVILVASLATTASASPELTGEALRREEICDSYTIKASEVPQVLANMPCNLSGTMVVTDLGGGAVIPPPGMGVSMFGDGFGGSTSLMIETSEDGTVKIIEGP